MPKREEKKAKKKKSKVKYEMEKTTIAEAELRQHARGEQ